MQSFSVIGSSSANRPSGAFVAAADDSSQQVGICRIRLRDCEGRCCRRKHPEDAKFGKRPEIRFSYVAEECDSSQPGAMRRIWGDPVLMRHIFFRPGTAVGLGQIPRSERPIGMVTVQWIHDTTGCECSVMHLCQESRVSGGEGGQSGSRNFEFSRRTLSPLTLPSPPGYGGRGDGRNQSCG
jgi:hypothetical protein